jgi:hydrogenase-4 component F
MPLLGTLSFIGVLSLTGTPPFNIFLSEFTVLKATVDKGLWVVAGLFLLFVALVFYGMLSGFGKMLFGGRETTGVAEKEKGENSHAISVAQTSLSSVLNNGIMILLASLIIVFGLTVPGFIDSTIRQCIDIMGAK